MGDHPARFSSRKRGRDDLDDLLMAREDQLQRLIECAAAIHIGGLDQLVFDLYRREELAEQAQHVFGKGWMAIAVGIGNARDRLAQMKAGALAIRDVLGNLAQAIHVIDENNQARWAYQTV